MKKTIGLFALLATVAAMASPAAAASRALPWGGFEPPGGNDGDVFGIVCLTEHALRGVLADRGYTHVLLGSIHDEDHRVVAKATKDGATWHVLMNSCTGVVIDRNPV